MGSRATFDVAIVGGGIVGLSTALALKQRDPGASILLLEKEARWGAHQTGHNSGVIHSGIYYTPGSFKAAFCRAGNRSMVELCRQESIPHEICGKVIVATEISEIPRLERLYERGIRNGLRVERIGPEKLRELEPHVTGLGAIRVFDAGIVDYKVVCERLASRLERLGCTLRLQSEVNRIAARSRYVDIGTLTANYTAHELVNCGGLHSDRIAAMADAEAGLRIIPFRGEYYEVRAERRHLCANLIYPVPNPEFPFLGVHLTRMIGGHVEAGPNAVVAMAREAYRKGHFKLRDIADFMSFPGFWKLTRRYWKEGLQEVWRSLSKDAFTRSLQRLVPEIRAEDLTAAPAGIRAQALKRDGTLVDDFKIVRHGRCLHVCNAPSPAATAALEIGKHIAAELRPARIALKQVV